MSISQHTYTAKIVGTTIEVPIIGGSLDLDSGSWPHVSGSVEVPLPTDAEAGDFLAALDPRTGARLEVTATAENADTTTTRVFNLGIRERPLRLSDGTLRIELASDEALLGDYRTLAEDGQPYWNASSLRSVVNYVLGKAIPGKSLASQPNTNANVTPAWQVENLLINPRAATTAGWGTAAAAGAGSITTWSGVKPPSMPGGATTTAAQHILAGATTGYADIRWSGGIRVTEGVLYTASAYMNFDSKQSGTRTLHCYIDWLNDAGAVISTSSGTALSSFSSVSNTWSDSNRPSASGVAPVGAVSARLVFRVNGGMAASAWLRVTGALFIEGVRTIPYFDGNNADDANYVYNWQGAANGATSIRVPFTERSPESLVWQPGQSAMDFLMPLVQSVGLRLVCDEARTWTLRNENYTAPGAINIRHSVNMIDVEDTISRDSETWFDGMVCTYTWTAPDGSNQKRIDSYALSATPTRVVSVERNVAYPGAGFAEYAVRRAQGRGREVTGVAVADWNARAEQNVTIVLPSQPIQTGITERVRFDLNRDQVEVTARTRDTPTGAIDLLAGTIDGLTGNIDSL